MVPREKMGEIGQKPQFLQQNYGQIRRGKVKIIMQRSNWVYRIENVCVNFNYRDVMEIEERIENYVFLAFWKKNVKFDRCERKIWVFFRAITLA